MNSSIKEILRNINGDSRVYSKTCKVLSVSGNTCDCEPIDGSADILDVKLSPTGTGVRLTPSEKSIVEVSFLSNTEAYISSFSLVSKIEIDCDNIIFNGGNNDGLIIIQDLVTKLNNLENKVNDIITALSVLTLPVSGAVAGPPAPPPVVGFLTPTVKANIEDTKIKH